MANAFVQDKTFEAVGVFFLILTVLLQEGGATDFTVGWTVPTDPNAQSLNQWAEANRFQIGDSLVFNYPADQDSVLRVSQEDYGNCSIQSPIEKYSDGHTIFRFDKSGPYYFISGNKENCLKNEKLVVILLADRSNSTTNQTTTLPPPPSAAPQTPATSPSNPPEMTPSPAAQSDQNGIASPPQSESTEINPSPAPSGEMSPAPPPLTVVINPSPSPVLGPPPPSAASLIMPSCIGFIGAVVAALSLAF